MTKDELTVILLPILGMAIILLIIGMVIHFSSRKKIITDDVRKKVIEAGPAISPVVIQQAYETSAVVAPTNPSVTTIITVLLVIMGLFWLIIAFTQFAAARTITLLELDTGGDSFSLYLSGIWNIIISIVNLWLIKAVVNRKNSVVRDLTFLGIVGSLWGGYQLIFGGAYLQACAVPLYIILAVLAQVNKRDFINR